MIGEIMINDWVFDNENECYWQHNQKDYRCENRILSNFKPIPITEKILKDNGFNYDGGEIWDIRWSDKDGDHCMNFRKMYNIHNDQWNSLGIMMGGEVAIIKSVHELQHVLRIQGLDELANNFNIEE